MQIIDNILEDKRKAKIIIALSLVVFFLGSSSLFLAVLDRENIVDACNAHWKKQIEENELIPDANKNIPSVFNLSIKWDTKI